MPDYVAGSPNNHSGKTHAVPTEGLSDEYQWAESLCGIQVIVPVEKPDFRLGNPRKPFADTYWAAKCKRCVKRIETLANA